LALVRLLGLRSEAKPDRRSLTAPAVGVSEGNAQDGVARVVGFQFAVSTINDVSTSTSAPRSIALPRNRLLL